jgi:hypothetical protein
LGCALRFRPTYAVANVGHPSDSRWGLLVTPVLCRSQDVDTLHRGGWIVIRPAGVGGSKENFVFSEGG